MNWATKTVIGAILAAVGSGIAFGGYRAILLAGDARYLRQDVWVQENNKTQRLQLQRLIVPLQVKEKKGIITDYERALLETYRSQLQELRK